MVNALNTAVLRIKANWGRFWFSPTAPIIPGILRIGWGVIVLWSLVSLSPDVIEMFSREGWLGQNFSGWFARYPYNLSHFDFVDDPFYLLAIHGGICVVAALFTIGIVTEVTGPTLFLGLLSYTNRNEIVMYGLDHIAMIFILYLSIARCGDAFSLANFLRGEPGRDHWRNTVAVRLIQLQMCFIYLSAGLAKTGETWKQGTALWNSMMTPELSVASPGFLAPLAPVILSIAPIFVMAETLFIACVWQRALRPYFLLTMLAMHLGIAVFTKLHLFGLLMTVALLAFVNAHELKRFARAAYGLKNGNRSNSALVR